MSDYVLIPFSSGFIKRKRQGSQTTQPADHTQNGIRRVYTPSTNQRPDSQDSNEPQFEDLEIWKEPKIVTTYDSEYTKIHLIHWYFKSRNNLELSSIEKFHFSMLYMSDFDCKFDEIYFSVALDDINNETEKQFVRSQIEELTKFGTAVVDINFIQNDATKGELDTWLRIFDFTYGREDKCLLFYSHFKGVRHEHNVDKLRNIKYWSYLMYQGCLIDGWGEGMIKLPTNAMYGSYLRNNESDTSSFKLYDEYKKTKIFSNYLANSSQHYSGTFYWINLDFLRKNFFENKDEIKNTCLNMKSNLWFTKSHACEYLPCSFSFANGKLSSYSKYKNTELSNVSGYVLYKSNILPKEIENFKNIHVNFLIKNRKEKIIIAMTSWVKRINNVSKMIDKIKNQTLQPDHVYLTLSTDEFPNKENDLPKELVEIVDDWFTINWVKENTKTIKKIFPILQYLDSNDIIMNLDDDMLNIPDDLFESRINDFYKNGKKHPITGNIRKDTFKDNFNACGCCSVYQKKMFNTWNVFCNDEVKNTFEDDEIYNFLLKLNGYKFELSSKYFLYDFHKTFCINDNFGNNKLHYRNTNNTINICNKRYKEVEQLVDIIIPYVDCNDKNWQLLYKQYIHEDDQHFNEKYNNCDLFKYFFRSLSNLKCLNNIYLIIQSETQLPKWLNTDNKNLHIVYHKDFMKNNYPSFNSVSIMFHAFKYLFNGGNLTSNILYVNDDFYFLNETKSEDLVSLNKPISSKINYFNPNKLSSNWFDICLKNDFDLCKKTLNDDNLKFILFDHVGEVFNVNFCQKILNENWEYIEKISNSKIRKNTDITEHFLQSMQFYCNIYSEFSEKRNQRGYILMSNFDNNFLKTNSNPIICINSIDETKISNVKSELDKIFPNTCNFEL